jgi:hypothetical protein
MMMRDGKREVARLGGAEHPRPSASVGKEGAVVGVCALSWWRRRGLASGEARTLRLLVRAAESASAAGSSVFGTGRSGGEQSLGATSALPSRVPRGHCFFVGSEAGARGQRPGAEFRSLRHAAVALQTSSMNGQGWYDRTVLREAVVPSDRWPWGRSRAIARGPSNPSLVRTRKARRTVQSR